MNTQNMNNQMGKIFEKKEESSNKAMYDDYRVALVDLETLRYIGTQGKMPILLGGWGDPASKPFIMKSKFVFLPRIGEKISLPNHPNLLTVKDIVHDINYTRSVPPYHLLFVNFSNSQNV